ncbi:hypothetical protein BV20DRAFT_1050020 [Pilatotrama ljubarskyi]|nr:hypothetical protein BV20DRAFT_1058076 [Pilatotrama ljubarskyi]KAI0373094.1 hypothetical protein BV20DRAFT_1050020 [Pilatotrama ljubarskyi]
MSSSTQETDRAQGNISLDHLRYNQVGLASLCRFLGDGPLYRRYQARFDAADVAWFAAGAHKDGSHDVEPSTFHQAWYDGRLVSAAVANTPLDVWRARREVRDKLKELVLDAVTMLDRQSGGASFWVHVDGTVRPQQPIEVSSLKIDAYVPPHLLREIPGLERSVAQMVQQFAETIGLPATARWLEAFAKTGLSLPERAANPPPPSQPHNGHAPAPLIPPPIRGSTHYIFHGRHPGELERVLQGPTGNEANDRGGPPRASRPAVEPASTRDIPSETLPYEEINILRGVIFDLEETVRQKDREIARLRRALQQTTGKTSSRMSTPATSRSVAPSSQSVSEPPRTPSPTPIHAPLPLAAGSLTPSATLASVTSRAHTPNVTPSSVARGKRPAQPAGHLTPAPRTPASSPISVSRSSDSRLTSPLSSPLSTTISVSTDWLPTVSEGASDTDANEWVMPGSQDRTPSRRRGRGETSSQSPEPPFTRFTIIGPHTQSVVNEYELPAILHRDLGEMAQAIPYQEWFSYMIRELGIASSIAEELFDAMMDDTVPESSASVQGR